VNKLLLKHEVYSTVIALKLYYTAYET